jgi:hypothetical protein
VLSLADRIKLLKDNWRDRPEQGILPSRAVGQFDVPVIAARAPLATAEFLDEQEKLPVALLRLLGRAAIDMGGVATELRLPARVDVRGDLRLCQ